MPAGQEEAIRSTGGQVDGEKSFNSLDEYKYHYFYDW